MLLSLQPVDLCSLFKCYSSDDCEVNEMEIQQCVYCVISEEYLVFLSPPERTLKFFKKQGKLLIIILSR